MVDLYVCDHIYAKTPIYMIDNISKNKSRTKKSKTKKSFSEQCARIFTEKLDTFAQNFFLTNLEEIFANLIQTLTSEDRVLKPKADGFQGRSPCWGFGGAEPT